MSCRRRVETRLWRRTGGFAEVSTHTAREPLVCGHGRGLLCCRRRGDVGRSTVVVDEPFAIGLQLARTGYPKTLEDFFRNACRTARLAFDERPERRCAGDELAATPDLGSARVLRCC